MLLNFVSVEEAQEIISFWHTVEMLHKLDEQNAVFEAFGTIQDWLHDFKFKKCYAFLKYVNIERTHTNLILAILTISKYVKYYKESYSHIDKFKENLEDYELFLQERELFWNAAFEAITNNSVSEGKSQEEALKLVNQLLKYR